MSADFTPRDVHAVFQAELPGDGPPLMAKVAGSGSATHIYLESPDVRDRLRVAIGEYEAHRERAGNPEDDPDAKWWYPAWGEALLPALKQVIEGE